MPASRAAERTGHPPLDDVGMTTSASASDQNTEDMDMPSPRLWSMRRKTVTPSSTCLCGAAGRGRLEQLPCVTQAAAQGAAGAQGARARGGRDGQRGPILIRNGKRGRART
jgi:hypothetical protein